MRRKTYLLFELLIAASLLALCAVPLIRNPMHMAREEVAAFERIELERVSELAFAKVLEKLYSNEIPWEAFQHQTLPEVPSIVEKVSLELPGIVKRSFDKKIYLWTRAQKEGPENEDVRLVGIKITFAPIGKPKDKTRSFTYRVLLEAKKNAPKKEI